MNPFEEQAIALSGTEDQLFAELGRLYFKNMLLHQRVVRLEMEAALDPAKLASDGADDDDVPGDGDAK